MQVKIQKGNVFNLKVPVDMIVYRSGNMINPIFYTSTYPNSRYSMVLPEYPLNNENAICFLENYKKVFRKVQEIKLRTIAIEAVSLENDDLTVSFAAELKEIISSMSILHDMVVYIICRDRNQRENYELAILGEIKSSQITIIDQLESCDAIIIPTKKKPYKIYNEYKSIKKLEAKDVFLKLYWLSWMPQGYIFIPGKQYSMAYYLMNFDEGKKQRAEAWIYFIKNTLESVFKSIEYASYSTVLIPVLDFVKNDNMNKLLIDSILDTIGILTEDMEVNIKLFCPDLKLQEYIQEYYEKQGVEK